MSNVRGRGHSPQSGYQTRDQIKQSHGKGIPRDDLREAFAGDENKGPASNEKDDVLRSTHVKSRKTEKSKEKTPIR